MMPHHLLREYFTWHAKSSLRAGNNRLASQWLSCILLLFIAAPLQAQVDQEWVSRYNNDMAGQDSYATALAIDGQGNVYVTGYSRGNGTSEDYATLKYDGQGNQLWVQRYDGSAHGNDRAIAVTVDGHGNVYVTGSSQGNYATVKYDPQGRQLWRQSYDGVQHKDDSPVALALDSRGNVYVTGNSGTVKYDPQGKQVWVQREGGSALAIDSQDNLFVIGSSQVDYVVTKYDPQGSQLWQQTYDYYGNDNNPTALAVDRQGSVYVTGRITLRDYNNNQTYLTVKYSSQGELQWAKPYFDDDFVYSSEASPTAIALDGPGNVYVTGSFKGFYEGDYTTIKYSSSGQELWDQHYDGPNNGDDLAKVLAIDQQGNIDVAGISQGDYTTVKYNPQGGQLGVQRYDSATQDVTDKAVIIVDSLSNVYLAGYSQEHGNAQYATGKYAAQGSRLWLQHYYAVGNGDDNAQSLAVDPLGNSYVGGTSQGGGTSFDFALVKYDSLGKQLWLQRYDGPDHGEDALTALALDGQGNVYVTGGSQGDYATLKYDSQGNQLWVKRYDGAGHQDDRAAAIAVDQQGNVWVTGYTTYGDQGFRQYTTIKYDQAGNQLWVHHYQGSGNYGYYDGATALALDGQGNVYVTGGSQGDYAILKCDAQGHQLWVQRYDGPNHQDGGATAYEGATALALDAQGNIYVSGKSERDYATLKYDPQGKQLWVQRFDGPDHGSDQAVALAIDRLNNVYVTGTSSYPLDMYSNTSDYVTVKYDSQGKQLWVQRYDGPGTGQAFSAADQATALAIDSLNNVYVTGSSSYLIEQYKYDSDYVTLNYDSLGQLKGVRRYSGPDHGIDQATALALDGQGNIYVTGSSFAPETKNDFATVRYRPGPACDATGTILREVWTHIGGHLVSDIPLQTQPDSTNQLRLLEAPSNVGDNYGSRIRGYLCVPVSGQYKFYLAADDNAELWLSSDDLPEHKQRIADISGSRWTGSRQWDKYASQQSDSIYLQAGYRYYLEALHKEGQQQDNLAVAWRLPDGRFEGPIPGERLAPFLPICPVITMPASVPVPIDGIPYYASVAASPTGKYTYTFVDGSPPLEYMGLSLNPHTGEITGTPYRGHENGIYKQIRATDAYGCFTELYYNFPQPLCQASRISDFIDSVALAGQSYETRFFFYYGKETSPREVMWQIDGSLPEGLDPTATPDFYDYGVLSGTPTTPGSYAFEVGANLGNYSGECRSSRTFTLTVYPAGSGLQQERWNGIASDQVAAIPVKRPADTAQRLTSFATPANQGDQYGERLRGYLTVPQTGDYTFFIAADNEAALYLSPDDSAAHKVRIASLTGYAAPQQWNKYPSQQSVLINLVAGQKYYVEALHKEGTGEDNLAVAWRTPSMEATALPAAITASVLTPYIIPESPELTAQGGEAPLIQLIWLDRADNEDQYVVERARAAQGPYEVIARLPANTTSLADSGLMGNTICYYRVYAIAGTDASLYSNVISVNSPSCTASGTILREYWANVPGSNIRDIPLNTAPTFTDQLTMLSTRANVADAYGQRIRGYLCAPETGNYAFYIQGDDQAELYLSSDDDPAHKQLIASSTINWRWYEQSSQIFYPVPLVLGRRYYLEVLHKEGSGGDVLRVGWQTPSSSSGPVIIPGAVLSPFVMAGTSDTRQARVGELAGETLADALTVSPNPFSDRATIRFSTATTEQARLEVYDTQGRVVSQLFDGLSTAGEVHQLSFDGQRLSQGLYLVKLATSRGVVHQKLLLTR